MGRVARPRPMRIVTDPASNSTDRARADSRLDSMAVMIARGIVWVFPMRLPANMMVAPNSDRDRAQAKAKPVRREGAANGTVSLQNVPQGDIPKV